MPEDNNVIEPTHAIDLPDGQVAFKHNIANEQPVADKPVVKGEESDFVDSPETEIQEVGEPSSLSAALGDALGEDNVEEGITDQDTEFVQDAELEQIEVDEPAAPLLQTTPNRYRDIIR